MKEPRRYKARSLRHDGYTNRGTAAQMGSYGVCVGALNALQSKYLGCGAPVPSHTTLTHGTPGWHACAMSITFAANLLEVQRV
jgi:hypothetical protein